MKLKNFQILQPASYSQCYPPKDKIKRDYYFLHTGTLYHCSVRMVRCIKLGTYILNDVFQKLPKPAFIIVRPLRFALELKLVVLGCRNRFCSERKARTKLKEAVTSYIRALYTMLVFVWSVALNLEFID